MKQDGRPFWLKAGIFFGSGLLSSLLYLILIGFFSGSYTGTMTKALSDACLLPGAVMTVVGVLSWVASKGFFDLAGFATFSLFGFFIPRFNAEHKNESLYEYKVRHDEKGRYWLPYVLIPGLLFLAASVSTAMLPY